MVICLCSVYNLVILFSNSFVAIISEFSIENMQWNWDLRIFFLRCCCYFRLTLSFELDWTFTFASSFRGKIGRSDWKISATAFYNVEWEMFNVELSFIRILYTHTHYILVGLSLVLFLFGWNSRFQFDSFQQNFSLTIFAFYSRIILFSTVVILPPKTPK